MFIYLTLLLLGFIIGFLSYHKTVNTHNIQNYKDKNEIIGSDVVNFI